MSPFCPSFLQPPALHPENDRFLTPLFSSTSELLFSQLLCLHIYLRCPLLFSATLNLQYPSFCQRSLRLCALCVSVANPSFSSVRLPAIAYHWLHVLRPRGVPCSWPQPQPQQHPTRRRSAPPVRADFPGSAPPLWPAAIPRAP